MNMVYLAGWTANADSICSTILDMVANNAGTVAANTTMSAPTVCTGSYSSYGWLGNRHQVAR